MTAVVKRRVKPQLVTAEQTTRSGVLRGPARVVMPAIRQVGSPWQFDARLGRYLVPLQSLDDVLAAIELDGHRVMRMAGWS